MEKIGTLFHKMLFKKVQFVLYGKLGNIFVI